MHGNQCATNKHDSVLNGFIYMVHCGAFQALYMCRYIDVLVGYLVTDQSDFYIGI